MAPSLTSVAAFNVTARIWISLCALCLALSAAAPAAAANFSCSGDQLAPFQAGYEVLRNGKTMGRARASLEKHDGVWVYRMETRARRGLAGLLGGEISESSEFLLSAGQLQAQEYRYQQGVAFSKRSAWARFDWQRLQVSGEYRKDKFELPLVAGQSDRMLVNLKLMQELSRGTSPLDFDVVEKGRVDRIRFERLAQPEMVDTPQGRLVTLPVVRLHRNPKRQTRSWHAPDFAWLPVRMQQIDTEDDEMIEMILTDWSWEPCRA